MRRREPQVPKACRSAAGYVPTVHSESAESDRELSRRLDMRLTCIKTRLLQALHRRSAMKP